MWEFNTWAFRNFRPSGTEVGQEISAALAGRATVEQALALAQAEAERALEGRAPK